MRRMTQRAGIVALLLLVGSLPAWGTNEAVDEIGTGYNCDLDEHVAVRARYKIANHNYIAEGTKTVNEYEYSAVWATNWTYAPEDYDRNVTYAMSGSQLSRWLSWPTCLPD